MRGTATIPRPLLDTLTLADRKERFPCQQWKWEKGTGEFV